MAKQFLRQYKLDIIRQDGQAIRITDLRIIFDITKDLFGYPNLLKISILNLSRDSFSFLNDDSTKFQIDLQLGYKNNIGLKFGFRGEMRNVIQLRDGENVMTDIYAGDGQRAIEKAFFDTSYKAGTAPRDIIEAVGKTFGLAFADINIDDVPATLKGTSYSGDSKNVLNQLADQYNFYWSIQDNTFTVIQRDRVNENDEAALNRRATLITRNTGMIGSPALTEIGADVVTLLNPNILPGGIVKIESVTPEINLGNLFFRPVTRTLGEGYYRVNKIIQRGDTRSNSWTSTITGRTINSDGTITTG